MSTALTQLPPAALAIQSHAATLRALLPTSFDDRAADRFVSAMVEVVTGKADFSECSQAEIIRAATQVARLGLDVGAKTAYLIPQKVGGVMTIRVDPGYRGTLQIVYNSGLVSGHRLGLIYKGEHYIIDGGELLEHRTDLAIPRNKNNVIGAYCFFRLKSGGEIGRVIDRDMINKARSYAAEKSTGWTNNWEEMALKTAILRAAKSVPFAPDIARAIAELYAIDAEYENAIPNVQPERPRRRVLSAGPQPLQLTATSDPSDTDPETIDAAPTTPAQDF